MNDCSCSRHSVIPCICVVCFMTNMSQMPMLLSSGIGRYMTLFMWSALGVFAISRKPFASFYAKRTMIVLLSLFLTFFILQLWIHNEVINSTLPYSILLSAYIFIVGCLLSKNIEEQEWKAIFWSYIISAAIVAVAVLWKFYRNNIFVTYYVYGEKNSTSQILLTAAILAFCLLVNESKQEILKTIFLFGLIAFLTFSLLVLRSRATLIAIPVMAVWILCNRKINTKAFVFVLVLLICGILVLVVSDKAYDIIVNRFILNGNSIANINTVSSGRSKEWVSFSSDFLNGNIIIGEGKAKRESIVLTALLEYGIIGGTLIFAIALFPLFLGNRIKLSHSFIYLPFMLIAIAYCVNGVFEQLAPFGPGAKCYFLWLLCGLLKEDKRKNGDEKTTCLGDNSIIHNHIC